MAHGKYEKKRVSKRNNSGIETKRLKPWQIALIVIAVILVVFVIAVSIFVNHTLGKISRFEDMTVGSTIATDEFETSPTVEGQETIETMKAEDVVLETVDPLHGQNVVNILLIGQDDRPGESRARSDTMILVSLNKNKNAIQLTSFMRDTYVQIPGWADNRLNVPYRYEGVDLLNETLLVNFGIQVDGDVAVDFEMFQDVIDILGGVKIEITQEEADAVYDQFGVDAEEGMNEFDGEEALAFCRIRYNSGGDYGRSDRQRRVIESLIKQFKGMDLSVVMEMIDEVLPKVYTNLSNTDIINYATAGVGILADGADIQSMRIPADDAHYMTMINGMSVLLPDLEMCREDLKDFIYE